MSYLASDRVTGRFGVVIHRNQPYYAVVRVFCDVRMTHIELIFYQNGL